MPRRKKQDTHLSFESPIVTVSKESTSFSSRSASKSDRLSRRTHSKPAPVARAPSPIIPPKFPPHIPPPDTLMWDLCRAIQCKAWTKARKLTYEMACYDPCRTDYHDLHRRIDAIIALVNQRLHPRVVISRPLTAASSTSRSDDSRASRRR